MSTESLPACTCFVGDGLPRQHTHDCARTIALDERIAREQHARGDHRWCARSCAADRVAEK